MANNALDILILIARPAAGKSEVIDYLKHIPFEERAERFHIGGFREIDDFPMLWTWFEEDALLERLGHPRIHTDSDGYFRDNVLWNLLIQRISLEYTKLLRDNPDFHDENTVIIEFARGAEHGGFAEAFNHLTEEVLNRAAVMYIDVSWEESLRKNRRRFNPDRPDSILEHGLPDEKLERLYKDSDWAEFSGNDPHWLKVNGSRVPYVVFDNHDDVTTNSPEALGGRLEAHLNDLWALYRQRSG
jgi:hypothetical protein